MSMQERQLNITVERRERALKLGAVGTSSGDECLINSLCNDFDIIEN